MAEGHENTERQELSNKILAINSRLENDYQMFKWEIAEIIGISKESYWKYSRGKLPKAVKKLKEILEKLEKTEELKKLEKMISSTPNENKDQITVNESLVLRSAIKLPVCIYFPQSTNPEPYRGEFEKFGSPLKLNGVDAIIAEPSDSKHFDNAEGVVPSYDPAAPGCSIAIKRIKIEDCVWGRRYYIFDTENQAYLRKIYKEPEGIYKLVSNDPVNHPDYRLHESRILVVFRVIKVLE